jgi:hypothetical protein
LRHILRNQASHHLIHQQYAHLCQNYNNIDKGVRIVDVTGEGLPDFLKCDTAGQCKAWINTGSGWKLNDNWKPHAPFVPLV